MIKKIVGLFGIVYITCIHLINIRKYIIVLPDGIGEIINSALYWDSSRGNKELLLLYNKGRNQVLSLIDCKYCKFIEVPDYIHKCNKSIIFSQFGKLFLKKNKNWVVIPLKDPNNIDFEKGFIWNIKDAMNANMCDPWRLRKERNNKQNNVIYINPFARTVPEISPHFFEVLVEELTKKGFDVVTIIGNKSQSPIAGSKGVVCGLENAVDLIRTGEGIIGLRSGFMDLMANKLEQKIICLYPKKYPYIDFFSFSHFEHENNVKEYVVDDKEYIFIIEKILEEWN